MKRFWDKVQKSDGCWEWTAYCTTAGYGALSTKRGMPNVLAHRASWEMAFGSIPDGMCVLHKCDNRKCVRPEHLFLGTRRDNTQDMMRKKRNRFGMVSGEAHGRQNAKIGWEDAKDIRHFYFAERRTAREIAEFYGLARQTVKDVVAGRSWQRTGNTV